LKLKSLKKRIDIIEAAVKALKERDESLYNIVEDKYFAALSHGEIRKKHDLSETKLKKKIDEALMFIAVKFKELDL